QLLEGLKRLEYRGYDSAGIATLNNGQIERSRAEGKLKNLDARLKDTPISGSIGIGHTRWATHGIPNEENAHPHATDKVALVHNGIIENYREIKDDITMAGHVVASDTDTEVVAHLIHANMDKGLDPVAATGAALKKLIGAFALGIIFAGHHDLMIAARRGSPLAIGHGDGEMYLGSDAMALVHLTNKIQYLEDGDWAVMSAQGVTIYDAEDNQVERDITLSAISSAAVGKAGYRHFMLKEIYEQPQVIGDTLHSYINPATRQVTLPLSFDAKNLSKVTIIACGTAYLAGMVAKYWLESIARVPVEIDVASEFRYRAPDMPENGVALFISQSGETMDTLESLRYARKQGQHIASVVNVPESTIARESDSIWQTYAGPEIGVASTKAFTTQLTVLACLTIAIARERGTLDGEGAARLMEALVEVPARAAEVLNHDENIQEIAKQVAEARDVLYLGRGTSYPIALEGALKLKEISYIHAEGYAAGEMKHGPIALIDENVPVIVIAPSDPLFEKTASNLQEVVARGGKVVFFTDQSGQQRLGDIAAATIALPGVDAFVAPILHTIPVQLLAYHVAVIKGTDVDQPRNLAKSVTVE
ncbi:MAG: glutamine--fructose-6-phosphate transaminase (isomerizing), partial [Rhodospirillales bacterium]|nr:glutamine--fructose-6-phosphate transaminase (isomerizing) [Rhodospirillales bacterium]